MIGGESRIKFYSKFCIVKAIWNKKASTSPLLAVHNNFIVGISCHMRITAVEIRLDESAGQLATILIQHEVLIDLLLKINQSRT